MGGNGPSAAPIGLLTIIEYYELQVLGPYLNYQRMSDVRPRLWPRHLQCHLYSEGKADL
jgi:hypothetical protein